MNKKFKVVQLDTLDNLQSNWSNLGLDDYYAVLLKTKKRIDMNVVHNFIKLFGNILDYGDKDFVIYDTIHQENPLHFDGVSSIDKKRIPDRLFFFVEETPKSNQGTFRILNCESVLHNLDKDVLNFLKTNPLEYYGYSTLYNDKPNSHELVFSHDTIWNYNNIDVLRMQIPSLSNNNYVIEKDYVYCNACNYRTRFKGFSGKDTAYIFKSLHDSFNSDENLFEINFNVGDFLITKNKFTFHGRHGARSPLKRKMYRFQTIGFK